MLRVGVDGRVLVDRYHGIGRCTYELLVRLVGDAEFQFVVFVDPDEPATRFDLESLSGPSVRFVRFPVPLPSPVQFLRWPALLRREGVDVTVFPYQLGASLVGGGRRVTIIHDCLFEEDSAYAPSRRIAVMHKALTRVLLRRSDVVVPSLATSADLHRYYRVPVPAGHVIEWGVSGGFSALTGDGPPPIEAPYLLHVGARRPHKNVPFLVRVLAALDAADDMHLVLVGSPDSRWPDPTVTLARELGVGDRVHQLHGVSDVELAALYRHAHAFVYPSANEGFGLPLLEAMAAGTPVVASDIAVFREIADGAAEFAPLDPAKWATAVERLNDEQHRSTLVTRGRHVAAGATWERAAGRLRSVLLETPQRAR